MFNLIPDIFRQLSSEEQTEGMEQWFRENFEDPAESTPWDEGEYVFVFGGPYYPPEVLSDKFGTLVPEAIIEALADRLADEKLEWAPVRYGEYCPPSMFADYEPTTPS